MGNKEQIVALSVDGQTLIPVDQLVAYLDSCRADAFWRDGVTTLAAIRDKLVHTTVAEYNTPHESKSDPR